MNMQTNLTDKNRSALETLLLAAQKAAEGTLKQRGHVTPVFSGLTPSGSFWLPSLDFPCDEAKEAFASLIRLVCIAAEATAGVLTLEAWGVFPMPGEQLDLGARPSLHPNRQEVVLFTGQALGGIYAHRFLPILRDAEGRCTGLGPANECPPEPPEGRFSRFLPTRALSAQDRDLARQLLAAMGTKVIPISPSAGQQ
jgi:hypothetical protein